MTLSDPRVARLLQERFTLRMHNQIPGIYCRDAAGSPGVPYPASQLGRVREGDGGGNIRLYFCRPDGRIAHVVTGYCPPERLLEACRLALARIAAAEEAETGGPDDPAIGRDIDAVLRQVEDDVYLKGAVG